MKIIGSESDPMLEAEGGNIRSRDTVAFKRQFPYRPVAIHSSRDTSIRGMFELSRCTNNEPAVRETLIFEGLLRCQKSKAERVGFRATPGARLNIAEKSASYG